MRCALAIAFFSLPALADKVNILPAPPADATALARAEYHRAEQEYAAGNFPAAEKALARSWDLQKIPLTQYNLALVHIKQGRLEEASLDMLLYFAYAPPAAQDVNNAAAKTRLRNIARLRGHEGRSGRKYARVAIENIRRGNYNVMPELDRAFADTQDLSLLYWIVLGEFRATKARYEYLATSAKEAWRPDEQKHMGPQGLDNFKRLLNAYFNGASDMADITDAQRLYDEIDVAWRRASVLEQARQKARRGL